MTVHSAKGLEYKYVYIVGLEENLFPSQRAVESPDGIEEERRLFNLLQDAYVQARYNKDFTVTRADIDALIPRIELLRDITEKVCCDRIAYYEQQS